MIQNSIYGIMLSMLEKERKDLEEMEGNTNTPKR